MSNVLVPYSHHPAALLADSAAPWRPCTAWRRLVWQTARPAAGGTTPGSAPEPANGDAARRRWRRGGGARADGGGAHWQCILKIEGLQKLECQSVCVDSLA